MYAIDQCGYCGTKTWCSISPVTGKPMCRGCRAVRFYSAVYSYLGFELLPWQERDIRAIYGTVRRSDGRRQFRKAYISVPKKNGKSFMVGGMPLLHLALEPDQESRPLEAYGAASTKDQAGIVFRAAQQMVEACPQLASILEIIPSRKRILRRDGRGIYQVISSDGGIHDGVEPSLVIKDELHRWTTQSCSVLYDVLDKGMISRKEPLTVEITTRGAEYECPLWERQDERARRIAEGILDAPKVFVDIHSADPKKVLRDPEYWKTRAARVEANPSHEDNGGFLTDEALADELEKAIDNPVEKPKFLRYHLNLMVNAREERIIDMDRWRDQDRFGVDLREWPTYDVDLLIRKWSLLDRPCWIGVDLSATIDLTAATLVFPPFDDAEDDIWTWLCFAWMAEDQVPAREARDHVQYSEWVAKGFLRTTPGAEIDTRAVKEVVRWAGEMFDLREVCFDPYNARQLRADLTDEGYTAVEIKQTVTSLNEPTRKMLALYQAGKLRHGNNPLLNFCAASLSVASDTNDLIRPKKPDRLKSAKRIDLISAGVTAMYLPVAGEQQRSVYEDREVLELG